MLYATRQRISAYHSKTVYEMVVTVLKDQT